MSTGLAPTTFDPFAGSQGGPLPVDPAVLAQMKALAGGNTPGAPPAPQNAFPADIDPDVLKLILNNNQGPPSAGSPGSQLDTAVLAQMAGGNSAQPSTGDAANQDAAKNAAVGAQIDAMHQAAQRQIGGLGQVANVAGLPEGFTNGPVGSPMPSGAGFKTPGGLPMMAGGNPANPSSLETTLGGMWGQVDPAMAQHVLQQAAADPRRAAAAAPGQAPAQLLNQQPGMPAPQQAMSVLKMNGPQVTMDGKEPAPPGFTPGGPDATSYTAADLNSAAHQHVVQLAQAKELARAGRLNGGGPNFGQSYLLGQAQQQGGQSPGGLNLPLAMLNPQMAEAQAEIGLRQQDQQLKVAGLAAARHDAWQNGLNTAISGRQIGETPEDAANSYRARNQEPTIPQLGSQQPQGPQFPRGFSPQPNGQPMPTNQQAQNVLGGGRTGGNVPPGVAANVGGAPDVSREVDRVRASLAQRTPQGQAPATGDIIDSVMNGPMGSNPAAAKATLEKLGVTRGALMAEKQKHQHTGLGAVTHWIGNSQPSLDMEDERARTVDRALEAMGGLPVPTAPVGPPVPFGAAGLGGM